jgi:hypothetical protein
MMGLTLWIGLALVVMVIASRIGDLSGPLAEWLPFGWGSKSTAAEWDVPTTKSVAPTVLSPWTQPGGARGSAACPSPTVDLRLLVIAADGTEPALGAIRQTLDYLGTPYTVWIATDRPGTLSAERLAASCRALFQGVVLTSGNLAHSTDGGRTFASALSDAEWQTLRAYQASFGIRQVTWSTFPTPEYGFQATTPVDTSQQVLEARLTDAGRSVFFYANPALVVPIRLAVAYLARPASDDTVPLLTDDRGHALAAIRTYADGRQNLALTFESNAAQLHNLVLAYGLVNWVTNGLFLGERHVYLSAQVDDVFLPNLLVTGRTYRITGEDLAAVLDWQRARQEQATTRWLRLDLAMNARGTTGIYLPDTLTPRATRSQAQFKWINHTYSHLDLDDLDYATVKTEITQNNAASKTLKLGAYSDLSLITPEVSGLDNPQAMQAAYDAGVRYLVSDSSTPGYGSPSPNAGIYNRHQPGLLMIPRHPTNLDLTASTPEEWVADYNRVYRSHFGRDLTYEQILDFESDKLLAYFLKGDMSPLMFHQANLRAFADKRTLLGDFLDWGLEKYNRLWALPILSPTMDELGRRMADRMAYDAAGAAASVVRGEAITLRVDRPALVPVTGLCTAGAEVYGGQCIAYIRLAAGESVTLPFPR